VAALFKGKAFRTDENGAAFVEAAILFPIMIMIFAALVLLAIYLPTRGALQRATQYAATVMAVVSSDTWLFFDEGTMSYYWETDKRNLKNVYAALFSGMGDIQSVGEAIVIEIEGRSISSKAGTLTVDSYLINSILYKEIVVTAEREFHVPVDFSFIRFPQTIPITVTSTAVVQNAGEFVRNVDMAVDFIEFIAKEFGLGDLADTISSFGSRVSTLLGWNLSG
jgi:hypothetical protein